MYIGCTQIYNVNILIKLVISTKEKNPKQYY